MFKVERTITIHAPVERVVDYILEPTNLPEFWPSLVEVKDVTKTPTHVGETFNWTYKMGGVHFQGKSERIEYVPLKRIVSKNTGGFPSTITWEFEPHDGETVFHIETLYELPTSLLVRLAEPVLLKLNEHEADVLTANLKARMEVVEHEKTPV